MVRYTFRYKHGHWVIYRNGQFWGTADTKFEAMQDVEEEGDEDY